MHIYQIHSPIHVHVLGFGFFERFIKYYIIMFEKHNLLSLLETIMFGIDAFLKINLYKLLFLEWKLHALTVLRG